MKPKPIPFSVDNQKKALQLKYLIQSRSEESQPALLASLNTLYPFTQYPLTTCPPVEFFETREQQQISTNIPQCLKTYCYLILTGGLVIKKPPHQYSQNRFLSQQTQQQIFFPITQPQTCLFAYSHTCYIKIHNIWLQLSKKNKQKSISSFIHTKLLEIPFFAGLSFQQFRKCARAAFLTDLGPGELLLASDQIPYHLYVVAEGELVFERRVGFLRDWELWADVVSELQRQQDNTCQQMFSYLTKTPSPTQPTFSLPLPLKFLPSPSLLCARQTLNQQPLKYNIVSTIKTRLICLKYPDLYNINMQKLGEIKNWPIFTFDDVQLRKSYYYQLLWKEFKHDVKREAKLGKLEGMRFQEFLRSRVEFSHEKYYYCPNKVGEGNIIDSPASKVSKLKSMTYTNNP